MRNQHMHFQTNKILSKLSVIVLSIVLLTGISLVPALQITANGQVQQQQQQQPYIATTTNLGQTPIIVPIILPVIMTTSTG